MTSRYLVHFYCYTHNRNTTITTIWVKAKFNPPHFRPMKRRNNILLSCEAQTACQLSALCFFFDGFSQYPVSNLAEYWERLSKSSSSVHPVFQPFAQKTRKFNNYLQIREFFYSIRAPPASMRPYRPSSTKEEHHV